MGRGGLRRRSDVCIAPPLDVRIAKKGPAPACNFSTLNWLVTVWFRILDCVYHHLRMPPSLREQRDEKRKALIGGPPSPGTPAAEGPAAAAEGPAAAAAGPATPKSAASAGPATPKSATTASPPSTPSSTPTRASRRPSWVSLRGPGPPQGLSETERSFSSGKSAEQKLLRRVKRQAAHFDKTQQWVAAAANLQTAENMEMAANKRTAELNACAKSYLDVQAAYKAKQELVRQQAKQQRQEVAALVKKDAQKRREQYARGVPIHPASHSAIHTCLCMRASACY